MKTIAELLSAYKSAHELTDSELAALIGADQSTVSAWVSGRRVPSDDRVAAIARAIGADRLEAQQAVWYTRRTRAGSAEEALALLTQLQTEALRLRSEVAELSAAVAELRSLIQTSPPEGPGKRQRCAAT